MKEFIEGTQRGRNPNPNSEIPNPNFKMLFFEPSGLCGRHNGFVSDSLSAGGEMFLLKYISLF